MAKESTKTAAYLRQEIASGRLEIKQETMQMELLTAVERAEKLQQTNNNLALQLQDKQKEITELEHRYEVLNGIVANQKTDSAELERKFVEVFNQNTKINRELELVKRRLNNSFTSVELADYLNHAIQEFNGQMAQASDSVAYTIQNLDVDMKAQIVKQNGELGFITSTDSGESAMSNIRISIVAVPK